MLYLLHWQDTVWPQESTYILRFLLRKVSSDLCVNKTNMWVFGAAFPFWKESWHVTHNPPQCFLSCLDGELYAGVYVDFMGTDSAIFRTLGTKTAMRTDQYNSRWLNGKCPVQPLSDWWDSGIARVKLPTRLSKSSKHATKTFRTLHMFQKIRICWSSTDDPANSFWFLLYFSTSSPLQTLRSSTCTSFPTARRETTTSCISSSGRSRQRWARVRWPSPV